MTRRNNGDMASSPLVSFIIISYNHSDFIEDCMKSIIAQTYLNMEILYLDDASGDGTFEKALEYKEELERKYEKVIFIQNEKNCGLVKNLNRMVRMCRGKYVKFLAADDFMLESGIEKSVVFMETHKEYDMIHSNTIQGNENIHYPFSVEVTEKLFSETNVDIIDTKDNIFDLLYERDFIAAPSVMLRRNVYDRLGLYDEEIGIEDWDYYLRVAKDGIIGYLDDYTVMYRFLSSSLSHSTLPQRRMNMKKSELQILEKYKDDAKNAHERMEISFNEALQDAYHIDDADYIAYLYAYANKNQINVSTRNRFKSILYRLGIIKLLEHRSWHKSTCVR